VSTDLFSNTPLSKCALSEKKVAPSLLDPGAEQLGHANQHSHSKAQ
jgi:hypothetical protein